jgi:hypothetical protein
MKHPLRRTLMLALVAAGLSLNTHAETSSGRVDFGKFTAPAKGGEFVEVNVNSNLISLASQFVEKEQPDVAKLIRSVELVRVNVIGLTDENRDELKQRVQKIRSDLEAAGWERNVNVQGKAGEDVGVFIKTRGSEAIAGVAITVMDPEHVVLANVVGDIKPSQVAAIGESLHIQPLKEAGDAIKKQQEK